MKTIEIPEELHDQLMELSRNINSQNNRATAMPYFFQIRTNERVRVPEGCGTECWYCDDTTIETQEEIDQTIADYLDCEIEKVKVMNDWDKDPILEKAGWKRVNYDYEYKFQNAFLTEKSCKEHIERNHYHYKDPVDYLSHAFRNPDLELVYKFLCGLSKEKSFETIPCHEK